MRFLNGWQPARPSKRTCVLLMPLWFFIKTEVLLGIIYWLFPDGLKQKDMVRSPPIYPIDPRPPGINVGTRFLWCFMSSFCTFSLSTRHSSWCISCVCQHLKIVWESSKSDPANFSRITRHTFALALAPKVKKCDHFRKLLYPLPPLDQCWILCWWSNLCFCQHLSFQHWLGGKGVSDHFFTFM